MAVAAETGPTVSQLTLYFVLVSLLIVALEALCCWLWRRKRARLPGDGWLVLHHWPSSLKVTAVGGLMSICALPSLLFLTALGLGGMLAGVEGWSFTDGYEYVVCNMVGIGPLVTLTPEDTFGVFADVVISCWALILSSTILGLAAGLNVVLKWLACVAPNKWGFLRAILLHVPLLIGAVGLVTGALLSFLQDWALSDGLIFMIGTLCGIQDPLTAVAPTNDTGEFFVGVCYTIELLIGGAVIGAVGTHPTVLKFLEKVQGMEYPKEEEEKPRYPPTGWC